MTKIIFCSETQKYINKITIIRKPVFLEEKKFLKTLNNIHYLTLPYTIRKNLLFKEGDELNQEIIENTLRKLRSRRYIRDAEIEIEEVSDTLVNLKVITQDNWSTIVGAAVKKTDKGDNTIRLLVKEYNLFGTGKTIRFKKDILFRDKKDYEIEYLDKHFIKQNLEVNFLYKNSEIKRDQKYLIGKDFISDFDFYSLFFCFNSTENYLYNDNIYDNCIKLNLSNKKIIGRIQPIIEFHSLRNEYNNENNKFNYLFSGVKLSSIKYITEKNLFQYEKKEDIALGPQFTIGYKKIDEVFGANKNGWGYFAQFLYNQKINKNYIFQKYEVNNMYVNKYNDFTQELRIIHILKITEKYRWYNQLEFKKKSNYKSYDEFILNADNGLRGYNESIAGSKYILFNSEYRIMFQHDWLSFFYPEIRFLYDVGRTYKKNEDIILKNFYHNVGFNFKLVMYKLASTDDINITIAYPLKYKNKPYFSIGTSLEF